MKHSTWEAEARALRAEISRMHKEMSALEQDVRQVRARCNRLNDAICRAGGLIDAKLSSIARADLRNAFNESG